MRAEKKGIVMIAVLLILVVIGVVFFLQRNSVGTMKTDSFQEGESSEAVKEPEDWENGEEDHVDGWDSEDTVLEEDWENDSDDESDSKLKDWESDEEKKTTIRLKGNQYYYTDEIESFLFIGTDESGNDATDGNAAHGAMADLLLLVVINHTKQNYSILQLNRDTMTQIRLIDEKGKGAATATLQLCTAHWYGGNEEMNCKNTVRAVSGLLGKVPIDAYYSLRWDAIKVLNHEVDGVTVTIESDFSKVDPDLKRGETVTLTDEQAYEFVRMRFDIDDGENLSRMARHRQYLNALINKIREKTAKDNSFAVSLFQKLQPYATSTITGKQISYEAKYVNQYKNCGIYTIDGTAEIGSHLGDGIDHVEYYIDKDDLLRVMTEIYHLIPEEKKK